MKNRLLFFQKPGKSKYNIQLSICILSYNSKNYVERLIKSLLNQTDPRFEIIFSDDCSHDGTIDLVKRLIINSKFVPNGGIRLYKARKNFGVVRNSRFLLDESCGKYFKLIGADDMIASNYVEVLLGKDIKEADIFISDVKYIYNNNVIDQPDRKKRISQFLNLRKKEQLKILSISNPLNASSIAIKKECLINIDAYHYWPVRNIEDWETWFKLWCKGYDYKFSEKTFSYYELGNIESVDKRVNFSSIIDKTYLTIRFIKLNSRNFKSIITLILDLFRFLKYALIKNIKNK